MTKRKTKKAKRAVKRRKPLTIKKVPLPKNAILRVIAPKGAEPVVIPGELGEIRIVPVPEKKKQTWMEYLFGDN